MYPQFKLEVSGSTFINDKALTIQIVRPENNISFALLTVDDYKSESYVDLFDVFTPITLSLRYSPDAWTKVFAGQITTASPKLVGRTEVLEVAAWGEGKAFIKTKCDTSYGLESQNPTKDTPQEILQDLVTNYVNKAFGGAATGYAIDNTKVENVHAGLSVTHLPGLYTDNFTMVNRLCDVVNAYAQTLGAPEVSIHWYVDPDKNFYAKKIDADHSDGTWDRYWNGSQAASAIVVKEDMVVYDYRKQVEEYANKIVLCSVLRKPGYDYWTNNQSGLWGHTAAHIALTDEATVKKVGTHSLRIESPTSVGGFFWYPSAQNAGWDITKITSTDTIPTLNFYFRRSNTISGVDVSINTDAANYINWNFNTELANADTWYHFSLPLGPYYDETTDFKWTDHGTIDWTDINYFEFGWNASSGIYGYLDDLHFTGKIVREAYNSTAIAAHDEWQHIVRNDTAVDDSLIAATDTGLAARLAFAELIRRALEPIVTTIEIPLAPTLLPGQTLLNQACQKADGSYRINQDFRVKELRHIIKLPNGCRTLLNLTSDVTNTHAFAAPTPYSLLMEYAGALGHAEARDLKASGLDVLIPRLSKDYP